MLEYPPPPNPASFCKAVNQAEQLEAHLREKLNNLDKTFGSGTYSALALEIIGLQQAADDADDHRMVVIYDMALCYLFTCGDRPLLPSAARA